MPWNWWGGAGGEEFPSVTEYDSRGPCNPAFTHGSPSFHPVTLIPLHSSRFESALRFPIPELTSPLSD